MKLPFVRAVASLAVLAAMSAPTAAQQRTAAARPAEKIRQVVVYGRDPCPRGSGDEIVICARRPNSDRYRIPGAMRNRTPARGGTSWAARARSFEYVGRTGVQSCSTVGPGGHTGCWEQMMRTAREEREAAARGE
jgi:hypothetical protein